MSDLEDLFVFPDPVGNFQLLNNPRFNSFRLNPDFIQLLEKIFTSIAKTTIIPAIFSFSYIPACYAVFLCRIISKTDLILIPTRPAYESTFSVLLDLLEIFKHISFNHSLYNPFFLDLFRFLNSLHWPSKIFVDPVLCLDVRKVVAVLPLALLPVIPLDINWTKDYYTYSVFFFIALKVYVNLTYLYLSEIKKQGLDFSVGMGHLIICRKNLDQYK